MIMGLISLIILISGCATGSEYWTRADYLQGEVEKVLYVDFPCGHVDWLGCWNVSTKTIEIQKGLPPSLETCVLSHEYKHAQGFSHENHVGYAVDCGNGTMWIPLEEI